MRFFILFVLFLGSVLPLTSQTNFQRSYGGAGNERGHAIVATADGGYAIAGYTTSFGAGGRDFFVIKVNASGIVEWQKTYGSEFDDYGVSMAMKEAPGGGFIVVGSGNAVGNSRLDGIVFKIDDSGNVLWYNQYDTGTFQNSGDHARGIAFASNGDILISGTDDGDVFGSNDGLLIRLTSDGNILWNKVFGDHANEHFLESIELPGGNILSCGSTQTFGPGPRAAFVVKTDRSGNLIWSRSYGGDDEEHLQSILPASNGEYIIAGVCSSFGAGMYDALLCQIDSNGVLQWAKTYGGAEDEWGVGIVPTTEKDGYYLACYTESFGNGSRDLLIIRTDLEGELVWSKTFGTSGFESVDTWANSTLVNTQDGGFALTAWSDSLGIAEEDIILIKSNGMGDALCESVSITVTTAELTTFENDPGEGSSGTYSPQIPVVLNAEFSQRSFCHCGVACEPCDVGVVKYDLNDCYSNTTNGSDMDYTEFVPTYPSTVSFATITATNIYRENASMQKHSCTPGIQNSPAMCVSSLNSCTYSPGHIQSVVFEITIEPNPDSSATINTLSFFEKAPAMYDWINGPSGQNNYPTKFGLRILKNGTEVYSQSDIQTSVNAWMEHSFSFTGIDDFVASDSTTFRFELLAYCLINNGATVAAWDLDDIRVAVNCMSVTGLSPNISGFVRDDRGKPLAHVNVLLSDSPSFESSQSTLTKSDGSFSFVKTTLQGTRYLKADLPDADMDHITPLDMVALQKHLLGIDLFQSGYPFIAADVNNSQSLTALDLVWFRRLLVGQIEEFPNIPRWRFLDASEVPGLENPWNIGEILEIPFVQVNIGNAHFTGIQTGDVHRN